MVVPDGSQAERARIDNQIEIFVASHMWNGAPKDFESYLTPVAMDIHNNSSEPLEFRFEDVVLSDGEGHDANPIVVNLPNKFTLRVPGSQPVVEQGVPDALHDSSDRLLGINQAAQPTAAFEEDRIRATPMRPLYSWDWTVFREWHLGLRGIELPRVYLQRALLPTVIAAGKEAHGFLYFPRLPEHAKRMYFTWMMPRAGQVPKQVKLVFAVKG